MTMRFHVPSFVLGFLTGMTAKAIAPRIRPVALDIATVAYRLARTVTTHAARRREDFEDLLAEARARARGEASAASN
jgi:hypothetical protein